MGYNTKSMIIGYGPDSLDIHRRAASYVSRILKGERPSDLAVQFPNDRERQYFTLMDMLAAIISALDKQQLFQSITTYAGLRHARFGAKPAHFSAFGDALIWSLEQQFGSSFTPELRAAWLTLYDTVRSKMTSVAERAA